MSFFKSMNLPNKLTMLRIVMIPLFLVFLLAPILPPLGTRIVSAALFLATAITDTLDGKIARKRGLITDFGKFLDPVADKLMILAAMIGLLCFGRADGLFAVTLSVATFIVMARELGVTGLRLAVVGKSGTVIAANLLGKIKTVSQVVFVMCALLEPVLFGDLLGRWLPFFARWAEILPLTYLSMAFTVFMTIWSGAAYFKAYLPLVSADR